MIAWPSCEVLNAAGKSGVGTVLKQGLRDQPEMILASDADEQLLITVTFTDKCATSRTSPEVR
jgi:hypothetical protein